MEAIIIWQCAAPPINIFILEENVLNCLELEQDRDHWRSLLNMTIYLQDL